jgi:hypothetical protein
MPFQFINNECIDRSTRRLIRSHAAKGKNLGKTLPKRRTRVRNATPIDAANDRFISASCGGFPTTYLPADVKLSIVSFPIKLTSQSRRSLEKCMNPLFIRSRGALVNKNTVLSVICRPVVELQNSVVLQGCRTAWIQYLLQDEACCSSVHCSRSTLSLLIYTLDFHCNVAISLVMEDFAQSYSDISREALYCISNTYHLVTERLSSNGALSDPTLAVVTALVHYECLSGHFQRGRIHFNGLQKLVQLRGGITKLQSNPDITYKIFR